MPHLNLDLDYFEHPKTLRLVGLLGKGAEVLPLKLWRYCGKYHAEDGRLTRYSEQEIEAAAGWWGETGKAVGAMLTIGFLEKTKEGYQVHDWIENQGHIAAYRRKGRDMALARWGNATSNAASIAEADDGDSVKQCHIRHNQPKEPTNKTKRKKKSSGKEGAGERVEFDDLIPDSLRVPKFIEAWAAWINHRRERKPVYTRNAAERALPHLAAEGVEASVARIDRSICNGYQGLFFSNEKTSITPVNGATHKGHDKRAAVMAALESRSAKA